MSRVVVVTGAAGFVGSAVCRELLSAGARVVAVENWLHGWRSHLDGLGTGLRIVSGDVVDAGWLTELLRAEQAGEVIHCAGDTFVPEAYDVPRRFFHINTLGTLAALTAARDAGVSRLVCVSSAEVYGNADGPIHEGTPLAPVNTYAVSKLAADQLCATYRAEHGVPVVVARLFNCYGPRETHPYVVPEIVRQLASGSRLRLGNLAAARDFTYVHDTARALVALLDAELPHGAVVNVGSGASITVAELVDRVAAVMRLPAPDVEIDPNRIRRAELHRLVCDNQQLRACTGWSPRVDLDAGLALTVEAYRAAGRWAYEPAAISVG
jgi:nucleoside-diphosphate-sugar epimerase